MARREYTKERVHANADEQRTRKTVVRKKKMKKLTEGQPSSPKPVSRWQPYSLTFQAPLALDSRVIGGSRLFQPTQNSFLQLTPSSHPIFAFFLILSIPLEPSKMDSSKQPVKLVKVTRVLGRTGMSLPL